MIGCRGSLLGVQLEGSACRGVQRDATESWNEASMEYIDSCDARGIPLLGDFIVRRPRSWRGISRFVRTTSRLRYEGWIENYKYAYAELRRQVCSHRHPFRQTLTFPKC